tara:strand:+ start:92 stop:1810 length:1719 start_codon:yes stop_codon:yes gene_type:complete
MYSNTILKLDLIIIIIQKYCEKYLKPDKDIDKIKKSKTIQFVLDQLNDIRKTKDFKVLKSIFTIEKQYKIKDLKDWLNTLCANNLKLFSKYFKLDVEIDMTKGYRTYVNLLSKLENNKTKVDLKESNKQISILFNLLFYNIIVGGVGSRKKPAKDKSFDAFFRSQKENIIDKKHQRKLIKIKKDHEKSIATGQRRWRAIVRERVMLDNIRKKYGRELARESKQSMNLVDMLFPNKGDWLSVETFKQSLKDPVPRPYNEIYPIVQQSDLGSCWINSILVALMYSYYLKAVFADIIIVLLKEREANLEQQKTPLKIYKASFARTIQNRLRQLLVLQYDRNFNMTGKECIHPELTFVKDFITELTDIPTARPTAIFSNFSQVNKHPDKALNDIILDEGGTFADIFELIKILLTYGLEFVTEDSEQRIAQFYTKTVNDKKITICVIEKPENDAVREIPDFHFASIILRNYEKTENSGSFGGSAGDMDVSGSSELADMLQESMEEEKQAGHVTTVVTDDSGNYFLYNGWINNHSVTSLEQINTDQKKKIKTEDDTTLCFNLVKSRGIAIFFKVEPVS